MVGKSDEELIHVEVVLFRRLTLGYLLPVKSRQSKKSVWVLLFKAHRDGPRTNMERALEKCGISVESAAGSEYERVPDRSISAKEAG